MLDLTDGFWARAGRNRALLLAEGSSVALADTLIAQYCIDSGVALVARDRDYRHFVEHCGLQMAV